MARIYLFFFGLGLIDVEFHEHGVVVRVGEFLLVVVHALENLVVEDVVDAYFLLATAEGVHKAATALLETIGLVAQHRVIDVGVGYIVEVTADDDGYFRFTHIHCQHVGLTCTGHHTDGVVAVEGAEQAIALYLHAGVDLCLGGAVECTVDASGLQVGVIDADDFILYFHLYPHGTIVGHLEGDILRNRNGFDVGGETFATKW